MKTTVVIPVLNEGERLPVVIDEVRHYVPDIIIVDDGSNEKNASRIAQLKDRAIILRHRINLGKGAAMRTGVEAAIANGTEAIVLMDGDGQHVASDIPKLLQRLESGDLDIVFGSRTIGKDMPLVMMLGNKFLSLCSSFFFGLYVSDTQSGFRAFRTRAYPSLRWNSPRYAVETEIIANAAKKKLRTGEVQVQTIYHDDYKGTTVIDGLRIFTSMLRWKFL
jgi:UDP-N-acetylglucosamine---dolichyl-phosphate N-acetylglucosaminyltransferase